jgi:diaminopimelate epimerase
MRQALYSGAGNTFILADVRSESFNYKEVSRVCALKNVDGMIFVENSHTHDVRARFFNRDGSEPKMCGNGLRCLIHFLKELKIERSEYSIETLAGVHKGWFSEEEVCTLFPKPSDLRLNVLENLHFINTGVPHAVSFFQNVDQIDVISVGAKYRFAPLFAPSGTNVNFVALREDRSLAVRTYERGVEGETLACGTGSIASALVAHVLHGLSSPISVWVRSGERLKVSFSPDWSAVTLQGKVKKMKEISKSL